MKLAKSDLDFINKVNEVFLTSEKINILYDDKGVILVSNNDLNNQITEPEYFAQQLTPKELMLYLVMNHGEIEHEPLYRDKVINEYDLTHLKLAQAKLTSKSVQDRKIKDKLLVLYLFFSKNYNRSPIHFSWEDYNSGFDYSVDPNRFVNLLNQADNYVYRNDYKALAVLEKAIWIGR